MAARYAGKVRDWTMWNEPDNDRHKTIEQIVNFNIRTMKIIRRVIPDARIGGLSLANVRVTTDQYLAMLRKKACRLFMFTPDHDREKRNISALLSYPGKKK